MNEILEQIAEKSKQERPTSGDIEDTLRAAVALISVANNQAKELLPEDGVDKFFPFEKFEPSDDYRENLMEAVVYILSILEPKKQNE